MSTKRKSYNEEEKKHYCFPVTLQFLLNIVVPHFPFLLFLVCFCCYAFHFHLADLEVLPSCAHSTNDLAYSSSRNQTKCLYFMCPLISKLFLPLRSIISLLISLSDFSMFCSKPNGMKSLEFFYFPISPSFKASLTP